MIIKTYRIKQYNSKPVTVLCVNGTPVLSARGRETISKCIAYLEGYDVTLHDCKIKKLLDKVKEETK